MRRRAYVVILGASLAPIALLHAQQNPPPAQQEPTCDQVFKNITVFKGVPASDLIPAMEFMSASLGYQCSDCHDPADYSKETRVKEVARKMVVMQRDINTKNFNGRLEVTCMSCHNRQEHPAGAPIPAGISLRHERVENGPKPDELFTKHLQAIGKTDKTIVLTGTLTAPNDADHKVATNPLEMIQAKGGKFKVVSGDRKFGSDGVEVWYGTMAMSGEPEAIFGRLGRTWRDEKLFTELQRTALSGKDKVGKNDVMVVRATRPSTTSTEELYFDAKTGLLARLVNVKRSSLGSVVTSMDYANYKTIEGAKIPMKVTVTFSGGEVWTMDFKSAKVDSKITDDAFKIGG